MTGTFINAAAIIAGAVVGMLIKRGIPASVERGVTRAQGLAVGLIGLNGVIAAMFTVDADGTLSDSGGLLLLVSLVLGSLVGELIRIDDRLLGFGKAIEGRINIEGFAQGFISASIITCVGAMSIVGALNDGLMGDSQVLIVKSTLDFVTCLVLASSLGIGVAFAAIPTFVYQGAITLSAGFLSPYISQDLLNMICMVGYAIVICVGLNLLMDAKLKTANFLPAILVPILNNLLNMLKTL
ncbi:MAG: DUF554 domain-containing protein [Clostridiales bacterium]|nr:DUF554 domain-containing protein [Clostridiales bacterium]